MINDFEVIDAHIHLVRNLEEEIGFPVVLRVDSPNLPHKTELGLVMVGLNSRDELEKAFREIWEEIPKSSKSVKGMLIQEIVEGGTEVIVGIKQDPQSGSVLMFGLGGILTEVLSDIRLRACPVTEFDV